jgi:hypothetical protein
MFRLSAPVAFALAALTFCIASAAADQPVKLIHYGWENPAISKLPAILPKLAQSPFDGLAAKASTHNEIFHSTPFPDADFAADFATLSHLPKAALADSYLMINSATDGAYDWTNEPHWQAALSNMRAIVRLAKAGGFKGIVFDVEPYGQSPWDYSSQPDPQGGKRPDFDAYAKLVHARGAAMMDMMEAEFPGLEIWCLFGLTANNATLEKLRGGEDRHKVFSSDAYGLWPAFVSGWIEASDETTRIIDGNEPAYYYTNRKDFDAARAYIQKDLREVLEPRQRETYSRKIQLGQAVYLDGVMASANSPRFIGYYFNSDEGRRALLRANIMNAMRTSQSLVWVYAELPKWWDEAPDKAIDDTIRAAKQDVLAGKPAPGDLPDTAAAAKALSEAVSIGGTILDAAGKPVSIDGFEPALAKTACGTWGDHGEYGCTFPRSMDIVIEPVIKGRTLFPPRAERKGLDKNDWGVNFVVN